MGKNRFTSIEKEIFHVHTWRCKHAGDEQDFEYVEKAIELGAPRIVFTDHCPFPDNPFGNRMDIEQLPEYVEAIAKLKMQYSSKIEVLCGLEVEYLPSYYEYYKTLKESDDFDLLVLGQHFFEYERGHYDFSDKDRTNAYIGICKATVEGIKTGLFDVLAHPDRAFRKKESFDDIVKELSDEIIQAAVEADIYMEKNLTSMNSEKFFWQEFWDRLPKNAKILYGLDAHSVEELQRYYTKRITDFE